MAMQDLDKDQFERLYGPWATRTPHDVAALFDGYPGLWWIAGGWGTGARGRDPGLGAVLCARAVGVRHPPRPWRS